MQRSLAANTRNFLRAELCSLLYVQHAALAPKMTANIARLHLLANDAELAKAAADMMPFLVAVAGADR